MKQEKLFDDKQYLDRTITTPYEKKKWKQKFQEYCDSDKIRKESEENGLNACGYYYACDLCDGSDLPCACANATIEYHFLQGINIDFKNTSEEYLDKILRYEVNK